MTADGARLPVDSYDLKNSQILSVSLDIIELNVISKLFMIPRKSREEIRFTLILQCDEDNAAVVDDDNNDNNTILIMITMI